MIDFFSNVISYDFYSGTSTETISKKFMKILYKKHWIDHETIIIGREQHFILFFKPLFDLWEILFLDNYGTDT